MLLYSYIVVWFVVMFTTTLLTMSTLDVNHAQRAIATQQAFWAAEGELEGTVADLKVDQTVFALAENICLSYGSRNLKSDGSIRSTSSLCGTSTANTYRLAITGTSGSTTQTLSTIVEFAGPGTTQFTHVAYADAISADGVETYSVDTSTGNPATILAAASLHNEGGSLATRRAGRALQEVWDKLHHRFETREKPPIEILGDSIIHGALFLGPQWNGLLAESDNEEVVEIDAQADVVSAAGEASVQALPEEVAWPTIDIPSGVTSLGVLKLDEPNGGHQDRQLKMVLQEGAYEAERLILTDGAELCTIGTVELYVTGKQHDDDEADEADEDGEPSEVKVQVEKNAKLYGQPSGAQPYAGHYAPANLRIFVKGPGIVKISAKDSKTAALIYAPEAKVKAKAGTFLGAIMAKWVELEKDGSQKAKLVYDKALKNKSISVGTSSDVNIKVWTDGDLISNSTATTQ